MVVGRLCCAKGGLRTKVVVTRCAVWGWWCAGVSGAVVLGCSPACAQRWCAGMFVGVFAFLPTVVR